jgi:hypothetical protein
MSDRLTLSRAIEDAGIERAKAERVASAIVDLIHDQVATKADVAASAAGLRADVVAVRTDLKAADASLRSAIQASEGRLTANASLIEHRLLTRLGALAVVLFGLLFGALHLWPPH